MWICSVDGFYSVIRWHDGRMCVRARERVALERLRKTHLPELSKTEVSPGKDYRYRGFCTGEQWERAAASLARSVDYGNFKSAVLKKHGRSPYESALHAVWSVFARLQPGGPYSGRLGSRGYPPIPKSEKKIQGQQASFLTGRRPIQGSDVLCSDCGVRAPSSTMLKIAGGWVCRDVGTCLDRRGESVA